MRHNYEVHNRVSRGLRAQHKAKPNGKPVFDMRANGHPLEIKTADVDGRFRIGKKAHAAMLKAKGVYLFVCGRRSRRMSASAVSKLLTGKKWYKDRTYPHRFVRVSDVFGS